MFKVISIDEEKEFLPGYLPEKADDFHIESAKTANKKFDSELKKIKNKKVILMCGGSASGKTEFVEKFCPIFDEKKNENLEGLIFDSTLATELGAKIKIEKIIKSKNIPVICFVLPQNLRRCFKAFQNRERKVPKNRFFETHNGSRKTALWIVKNYPEVEILIYTNKLVDKSDIKYNLEKELFENKSSLKVDLSSVELKYYLTKFGSKKEVLEFLESIQFSVKELEQKS